MNDYQNYIHLSRYARWNKDENRRETWGETVERYISFFRDRFGDLYPSDSIREAILSLDVMPSMRALMTAGKALARDNIAGYNCSYITINHPRAFDEVMYILMCGTGVGFSCERQYVNELPTIAESFYDSDTTIVVADSRIGWATSYRELISLLYSGKVPKWDLSRVRPSGAILETFGGRASGPAPLDELFRFSVSTFKSAKGRKLNSLEVHDLVCKIADIVVVGGVRRSALISLSNLTDERLRSAKAGAWWEDNPQRALANNSVAYTEYPDAGIFLKEWLNLYESKSGERGIFNRVAATRKARETDRRNPEFDFGTNPCGEIILRPNGLCNLSEAVIRPDDSFKSIKHKVGIATIIGTFQSTLTDFRYVRSVWRHNCEEERLLGVSLTGIMDHPVLVGKKTPADIWTNKAGDPTYVGIRLRHILKDLKQHAINTNKEWADKLGINPSTSITCVKPSGTVSQLVGCSSGIHPAYSSYYIRTVRSDIKDPITTFLIDEGVPSEQDVTNPQNVVFSFPMKAPDGAVTRNNITALEQLEHYKIFRDNWCEHNPSITVYYHPSEVLEIGAWVYKNFNDLGGISFLPQNDHVYRQAPYQEITEEEYNQKVKAFPKIDWELFKKYEGSNTGAGGYHELACHGGACEL
jgi:ribonucleoside-triphosphate reductase (thioredoxin)